MLTINNLSEVDSIIVNKFFLAQENDDKKLASFLLYLKVWELESFNGPFTVLIKRFEEFVFKEDEIGNLQGLYLKRGGEWYSVGLDEYSGTRFVLLRRSGGGNKQDSLYCSYHFFKVVDTETNDIYYLVIDTEAHRIEQKIGPQEQEKIWDEEYNKTNQLVELIEKKINGVNPITAFEGE